MRSVPLRSFSDFVGYDARFSVPRESKWNERMISNLIYYQSNYFLMIICLHALCRQRNLKNKVCKLVESVRFGEQKTLMGYILEVFGVDVRLLNIEN
ncbi:unnamed protein product [Trichobilharzia regenti]|nr:unnamed protein product [Trichobilharzia regenti]